MPQAAAPVSMRVVELGQSKGPASLVASSDQTRCHGRVTSTRTGGDTSQDVLQPQPFAAQGLPELDVGSLCLIIVFHQLFRLRNCPRTRRGERRTEKRECFCSRCRLLDATPILQMEGAVGVQGEGQQGTRHQHKWHAAPVPCEHYSSLPELKGGLWERRGHAFQQSL